MSDKLVKLKRKLYNRRKKINSKLEIKRQLNKPRYFSPYNEYSGGGSEDYPPHFQEIGTEKETVLRLQNFFLQLLIAACLLIIVAIVFETPTPRLNQARNFVTNIFKTEFQFATVAGWYENKFGKPLALFPLQSNTVEKLDENYNFKYAVPATGKITKSFSEDGKGVIVETNINASVDAVKSGMVRFIAEDDTLGKTVIVSHYDGGESWYAHLSDVSVKLYDHIDARTKIGTVSSEATHGYYYFAIKEGEMFVNPLDVISFD